MFVWRVVCFVWGFSGFWFGVWFWFVFVWLLLSVVLLLLVVGFSFCLLGFGFCSVVLGYFVVGLGWVFCLVVFSLPSFFFFFCKNLAQMSGGDQPGDVQAGTAGTHHNSCCMETYVSWSLVSWSKAAQIRVFKPQRTAREGLGKVHFGIRLELGKD